MIVVTFEQRSENIPCVQNLRSQECDFELIIRNDDGIATARNEGIKEAENDYILFLDDDAIPKRNHLAETKKALDEHAVVTGRVLQPNSDICPKDTQLYDHGVEPTTVKYVTGCNMAFRRNVFETVGYFDEAFQWGHEEYEFSDRVRNEYDIFYSPTMAVTHPRAESRREYLRKQYLKGISDIHLWKKRGVPKRKWVIRCSPYFRPQEDLLETVGLLPRKIGRLRGLVNKAI